MSAVTYLFLTEPEEKLIWEGYGTELTGVAQDLNGGKTSALQEKETLVEFANRFPSLTKGLEEALVEVSDEEDLKLEVSY